jgi:hypothetical protein
MSGLSLPSPSLIILNILVCQAVARQRYRNKSLYNCHCYVTATQRNNIPKKKTLWPEFESELYRPSDRPLSAKLVPTFAARWCHVVRVADPYGRILRFLDRSRYFFFQVAIHFYSLLRKYDSAGNQTRTSGSVARTSDH